MHTSETGLICIIQFSPLVPKLRFQKTAVPAKSRVLAKESHFDHVKYIFKLTLLVCKPSVPRQTPDLV